MNDFTRDELQIIYAWGLTIIEEFTDTFTEQDKDLINKIANMSNNYCDHAFSVQPSIVNRVCIKCNNVVS